MSITATKVKCECVSKKQTKNWETGKPIATEIELQVPYDSNSIYHKLSGGSNMLLRTVNPDAADMFVIGNHYMFTIEPVEKEEGQIIPEA